MAIYIPNANNWRYLHFPVIGYITHVRNRVRPPIIEYVSYTHDHVQSVVRHVRQSRYISWSFPLPGYIKINTDGTFMQNSRLAGYRGIVRDDKGVVTTSCLTAELWDIHDGLTVAKNFNLKNVIIETDSREALILMSKGGAVDNHPDRDVIEECRRLLFELGISMMHTLREGNSCADHLAKLGRMQLDEDLVILHRPPHSMHQLLLADMAHVAYPRYRKHVR
ncbi:hypothetical protein KY290_006458 [Solanum tuberosum]|uniref:RNase H type-1 domain-containing protein n=1 Tax=Solanum tuberosum TaxID=4113 RepID=A0ABQ7WIF0_SOLTU|nr:hypothetical protein KY284_004756 [Solanum tuberosum]KAH0780031.1 hypothetical protein KY290_006458 [Solanum tuberosum]